MKAGPVISEMELETLLFKQVEKPKNHLMTKVINVFHDYYRINVYTQIEEEGLLKRKISQSYMTTFRKDVLTIIPDSDKKTEPSKNKKMW
jgi:hypothetical protein